MEYIASWSGGKDSTATIILAHEHEEPLNTIIFSEVMFDKQISGELPEHISFVREKCKPLFESWGYKVNILRAEKNYMDCFNHVVEKPTKNQANKGKRKGFVMQGHCDVQRDCKLKPIADYFKETDTDQIIQYVGIAIDEPKRLKRLEGGKPVKISLLQKYGYTEAKALELCKKYGLLSPIYDFSTRGGCWFCPNAKLAELKHIRNNYPDLWQRLLDLENEDNLIGDIWNTLKKTSIHDIEERLAWEGRQITVFDFIK